MISKIGLEGAIDRIDLCKVLLAGARQHLYCELMALDYSFELLSVRRVDVLGLKPSLA